MSPRRSRTRPRGCLQGRRWSWITSVTRSPRPPGTGSISSGAGCHFSAVRARRPHRSQIHGPGPYPTCDLKGRRPSGRWPGGSREVPMTTQVARQAAAGRAQRPVVSAGVPILAAKITAPGVPDWAVARPRITKLIAEGRRRCPLTVVTAPAGAGKTMALALWAAAEPGTVAWVGLDGYDNGPGVFWAYVVAALRRSGVAVPAALPAARGRASRPRVLAAACVGAGGPGPAGDAGPR